MKDQSGPIDKREWPRLGVQAVSICNRVRQFCLLYTLDLTACCRTRSFDDWINGWMLAAP